ncbi:unnamed protein product [Ranitomeya imitator]|uniref:Transposase IS30-like HTH domain-containing protein n=1 Tax=Ranitomeya imitator TaxID=111125 RepID=A0ABN9LLK2_9NEOB|nr:unnamed protein product [Ranitomeya imitator]
MRSKELSIEVKQNILRLKKKKKSIREIADLLGVAKSTVGYILRKKELTEYKAELEKNISSDTSEPYTALLLALAKGKRESDSGIIDYGLIEQESKILSDLGPKNIANSTQWIKILTERSHGHLRRVFDHFKKSTSEDIEERIKGNFKGDFQKGVLTLVAVIKDTPLYFADRLYSAVKGLGTDDSTLIRILISRSEVDLLSIRVAYRRKYGKSLYSTIQDTSRAYLQDYRML